MLRNRFLILLAVCFLAASAAWADDVGYVDCSSHSEGTQVFGKPRKSPEVVATLACGEHFTILVYGFYFSRIQTKDGQVGYVYSNLIAVARGATALPQVAPQPQQQPAQLPVQQTPSLQMATEKTKIPRTAPVDAEPTPAVPAQNQPAATPEQPAPAQPPVTPASVEAAPATASPASGTNAAEIAPAAVTPAPAPATQPDPALVAQPQPTSSQPSAVQPATPPEVGAPASTSAEVTSPAPASPAPDSPSSSVKTPEASAPAAEATPASAPQPEPVSAQPEPAPQPAAPAIKPADARESWEKPRPGARTAPLLELYGGYSFTRLGGSGTGSNLNGAMGSFGWNPKSWLQVVADTSYSEQTVGGAKNVLFGNHFGPRLFRRGRSLWGLTPFVEGLVGGTSERTTMSGATTSTGSALSFKVGGGIDIHPSRHWDIRLFDADYYRTTFGSGTQQNNYWISSGVVLRLFGGRAE
ncbi:MAG: hypothetical protein WBD72_03065 [Candidatus Acidiferrum sp.]